ncbi:hypothetical protein [Lentzea aerocolonigenes]|uniref:hypothetical protein n=1 Tax=Lentzea aerocolonigenes TaxID=68170 RepID=UPI00069659A5|nr:hypothetical protein [Lentzea aerocolonigenes]
MGEITISERTEVPPPENEAPSAPPTQRPWVRALVRLLRSEGALAFYVGLGISLLINIRVVLRPTTLIIGPLGDPVLQAWQMAWQHQFLTNGGDLWTGNQFYPAVDNLAFSDSLLGYLPLSLFGGGQGAAIFRYNVLFVLVFALAFAGGYLLVRQLGSNWQGAALAGVVLAWSPWKLTHVAHLNVLSVGGIAFALWAVTRGFGYSLRSREEPKPWWAFAGWLIAAWQVTLGFAVGITFFYVMVGVGIAVAIVAWRHGRRMVIANAAGGLVFLLVTWVMVVPYLRVQEHYGFRRTWQDIIQYSPPVNGLWTTTIDSRLWTWSIFNDYSKIADLGITEKLLFPGLFVVLFGVIGLFLSSFRIKARIMLAVMVVVPTVLSIGVSFFGGVLYKLMWDVVPGWDAMRTPGRLILWAILPLTVLAAGAVTEFGRLLYSRTRLPTRVVALLLVVPAIAALLEGIPRWPYADIPAVPAEVRSAMATKDPLLILPLIDNDEFVNLLWSMNDFPKIANGNSGNFPPEYQNIRSATVVFPDDYSLDVLKFYGIRKVLVLKSRPGGEKIAARSVAGMPLKREESGDVVIYTITG